MRKEEKNKNMAEANRLAEMEYQKGREAMGIPSESVNEEGELHMSPSGKLTTMPKDDGDYEINYGADAAKEEGYAQDDHGMGDEPGEEPINEKLDAELNEMKEIAKRLLGE